MSLFKHCIQCSDEKDCEWCEICSSFVCDDCDLTHDCLEEELEALLQEADEIIDEAEAELDLITEDENDDAAGAS